MRAMRLPCSTAAIAAVLVVVGCASKPRDPQVHRVAVRDMLFVPATLDVAVGDIVVWTNEDIVPHTVTAAGFFDSQSLVSGEEWRYTATRAGAYPYTCTFHPMMTATLNVR